MQGDPRYQTGKAPPTHAYEVGSGTDGTPVAPLFCDALSGRNHNFPNQLNGFEFQPSEICPKNFIIFDQNNSKSRIMYHPTLAHKLGSPSFNTRAAYAHEGCQNLDKYNDNHDNFSSSLKEDTRDIDALLSSGDEEEDGDEDDVISTGRTPGYCSRTSSGSSCSSEGLTSRRNSLSSTASSSERKRARMRKMVNALRGIIPGGDQMDTPAILDEAVIYLKSLKMEVKKLGIENLEI